MTFINNLFAGLMTIILGITPLPWSPSINGNRPNGCSVFATAQMNRQLRYTTGNMTTNEYNTIATALGTTSQGLTLRPRVPQYYRAKGTATVSSTVRLNSCGDYKAIRDALNRSCAVFFSMTPVKNANAGHDEAVLSAYYNTATSCGMTVNTWGTTNNITGFSQKNYKRQKMQSFGANDTYLDYTIICRK